MKISASLIVRDEESCLETALKSIQGVDEIVIVDTGSVDKTKEIASKYTDKLYTFTECNDSYGWLRDISLARNYSLSKCTGDWILIIDADEFLESGGVEKLRSVLNNIDKDAVYFQTISSRNKSDKHESIRLFRNGVGIKWNRRIHNVLSITDGYKSDITIFYGYSDAHKKDPDRTLRILTSVVNEEPNCVRERFYLAREYWYRKNYSTSILWYKDYLSKATWGPEMAEAWLMIAKCNKLLGKIEEARDCCLQAIKINANFGEACYFLSTMCGPKNKARWEQISRSSSNENVLFLRSYGKQEKNKEYYNSIYSSGYNSDRYINIYKAISEVVKDCSILDIGCGTGELSKYINKYSGFDFSEVSINSLKDSKDVWVGSVYERKNYKKADFYVLVEVLEHLDRDLVPFKFIDQGKKIIVTVPSFDDPGHLRVYTEDYFKSRYSGFIEIESIRRFGFKDGRWVEGVSGEPFILLIQSVSV